MFQGYQLLIRRVDRLLHHAHVLNIRGRSYRMKERKALTTVSGAPAPAASE